MAGPILPGAIVTMTIDAHTRAGTERHAFPVTVLASANDAGMVRVRAEGEPAARFGAMHWVRESELTGGTE